MKEIEPFDSNSQFMQDFKELFSSSLVPIDWDDDKKARVEELTTASRLNTSRVASIPMICKASKCPSRHYCPLYKENIAPLGMPCPIETKLIMMMMIQVMEELEVNPTSTIEVGMVRDFVDQEIQQIRKQNLLAQEDIIQENVVGIDESGEPIMKKELHLGVQWEDKIHKRKSAILKQLVATREAQINAGAKMMDKTANTAKALSSLLEIQAKRDDELLNKVGMKKDSYIEAQLARQKEIEEQSNGNSGE